MARSVFVSFLLVIRSWSAYYSNAAFARATCTGSLRIRTDAKKSRRASTRRDIRSLERE